MRKAYIAGGLLVLALGVGLLQRADRPAPQPVSHAKPAATAKPFNSQQYSLTDPTSLWVIVNKQRPLQPTNYAPADLVSPNVAVRLHGTQVRQATATALEALFAAAASNKTPLKISSGYRSYGYQVNLYNGYVQRQGQVATDAQSARPGYSEHQTGLAADLSPASGACSVESCFAQTPAGQWLAANAYKYGFIIRYPEGSQAITGYEYEPWHVRYVGVALATQMHTKHVATLEQFFGLPAAADY